MDRIIIIDDTGIQNDLNHFLKSNKNHIRLDSDITEFSHGGNSMIREIIENYENRFKIKIQSKDQVYIFRINEMLYFEAGYKNVKLYLIKGNPVLLEGDLHTFEDQLKDFPFFSTHHDFIVNINHISSISEDASYVILNDHIKVPISSNKKYIIINELEKYIK